jgi:hypothetical protein
MCFDIVVGLAWSYSLRGMPAIAYLLVGSPMLDRSKVIIQIKRDTFVL